MKSILFSTAASLALVGAAMAEVPSVAADIPPIYALVAKVMEGVGTPNLIVRPGASPHAYALRPSEAAALQNADIVFWVSEGLTPWLEGSIHALANDVTAVELLETEGTLELAFREGATFESHDHEEEGHEDHGHDPHAWLDPENARVWLDVIATNLATLDPENAGAYAANAAKGRAELAALITEIDSDLNAFRGKNYIVFHDAYQYFENRFDIAAVGAITLGDATAPSPARIAEIRDTVVELGVVCAFTEPQFNPGLLRSVFEGTGAVTGVLDPLGADLEVGPDLYTDLIKNLASNLGDCLK